VVVVVMMMMMMVVEMVVMVCNSWMQCGYCVTGINTVKDHS